MNREQFAQRLRQAPMLLDGAMGTVLHGLGVGIDQCFDAINCRQPALVAGIHRAYIDAGADILETNSFGANRFKLAAHSLEQDVSLINSAAVTIARRVIAGSFRPVLLAGSIGPLGVRLAPLGRVRREQAEAAFAGQIEALVRPQPEGEEGVDLLLLETMSDLQEVAAAVAAARRLAPQVPLIAMMTFTRDDRTVLGDGPAEVVRRLQKLEVDAAGINCSSGPAQVLRLLAEMRQAAPDLPLAVAPNAGWPEQTEGGRVLYPATPDYFGEYARAFVQAGAAIVGGCCGTTSAHIAAMRTALDSPGPAAPAISPPAPPPPARQSPAAAGEPTRLATALASGQFVVTVEMSPPRGISPQRLLAAAGMLREAGATFIDVADNPLARLRMSAWAAAYLVQQQVGVEAILHFPTRGRNLLRVQADLLAAHALGVRNLFVVMGDPTRIGDYPEAMDQADIVPTGLIRLIKQQLNTGLDKAGQSIDQPTRFVVGCALNLNPKEPEREMRLWQKKIRHGADFALTQPVFNPEGARRFLQQFQARYGPAIPVIAGIKPLFNSNNAEFLHNEVPGISLPDSFRERMRQAVHPQQEGVAIARELLAQVRPFVQGVYLMPAFGRYDLVADVLDALREPPAPSHGEPPAPPRGEPPAPPYGGPPLSPP